MLKIIMITFLGLISFDLLACECSKYPLASEEVIEQFVFNKYGRRARVAEENMDWVKYYPTFYERTFSSDFMQTSCGQEGPNGEPMFHCTWRDKSDIRIKFPKLNCEVIIQVTATYKKIKVRELSSTCPQD